MANDRLERLLDRLGIEEGDIAFLHTSYTRCRSLVDSPVDLIQRVSCRIGKTGTLVLPRYAWNLFRDVRPWEGYREYLRTLPPLDLRNTPANIGAVPEVFKNMERVEISISHFWPVMARGPLAKSLLHGQVQVKHAYGADSVFSRLLDWDAKVVGLGVTLNTTSIAPVTDFRLGEPHRCNVFTSGPVPGVVVDLAGVIHYPAVTTMRPEAVRDMKPSVVLADRLRPGDDFPFLIEEGNFFFSYAARLYHETALIEAQEAHRKGVSVPWFDQPLVEN
jgi:aminoglycoside N3'-acetyltransferase